MRPLQLAALGYLLVAVFLRVGAWDVVPDPVGWALVCLAIARLPAALPHRGLALATSAVAGVVSVPLALSGLAATVAGVDPALGWAASLPAFAATAALAHALTAAAQAGADPVAAGWLGSLRTLVLVVAVLPALVLGAGLEALRPVAAGLAPLTLLGTLVLLLLYAGRDWARDSDEGRSPVGERPS